MKDFLLETIQEAGKLALQWFHQLEQKDIHQKGVQDIVTEADIAVEKFIREKLQRYYPEFGFFGEESGSSVGQAGRWIVDPIDGTLSFARKQHYWSISIAVEVDGQLSLAAVYAPVLDSLYVAEAGKGALKNGKSIHVSQKESLPESVAATGFACIRSGLTQNNLNHFSKATTSMKAVRVQGSAALDLCMVAEGSLDAFWEMNLNLYDIAAGVLILREAGGYFSDFDGNSNINPLETFGSNQKLHQTFISQVFKAN